MLHDPANPDGLGPSSSADGCGFFYSAHLPTSLYGNVFVTRWNDSITEAPNGGVQHTLKYSDLVAVDTATGHVQRVASGFAHPIAVLSDGGDRLLVADFGASGGGTIYALHTFAATLTVPSQYPTIQAAINAAQNGDTVLISDGTYTGPGNVDLDFGGKNLTVTSVNGPASTIIDCRGSGSTANHRGFYLHSGETNAVISGLTIQNGYETYQSSGTQDDGRGGGVCSLGIGLSLTNCVIQNNTAYYGGGAYISIRSSTASAFVSNCTVMGNVGSSGGGVYNDNYAGSGSDY